MKNIIASIVLSSLLVGCNDIEGVLKATKSFKINLKNKQTTVVAGEYGTQLDFKRKKVEIKIVNASTKLKFELKLPAGQSIPANGSFSVTGAQSGQPFDILGTTRTVVIQSDTRREYQGCSYQVVQTICSNQGCYDRVVTVYGQQDVAYYLKQTDLDLKFNLTEQGKQKNILANFSGHNSYTEKVITYQSRCY